MEPKEDDVIEGAVLIPLEAYEDEALAEINRVGEEPDLDYYYAETKEHIDKEVSEPTTNNDHIHETTVVEHPIWGKGFITQVHGSHIAVKFPDINEVRLLPSNATSIRQL